MQRAFTLIELLVVVTIIVVLLALLTPALSKATYQAQLVACGGGNLKVMGNGIVQYAMENKRYYPDRGISHRGYQDSTTTPLWQTAMAIYVPGNNYDMRPSLRPLFSINRVLQCPLTESVELDNKPATSSDVELEASYAMFWGWQYKEDNFTHPGMFKMGDRLGFGGSGRSKSWAFPRAEKFRVLAGDIDLTYDDSDQASHPDLDLRRMGQIRAEDTVVFGTRASVSRWRSNPRGRRGLIDTNFVFDDGSITRSTGVTKMDTPLDQRHEGMSRVPVQFDSRRLVGDLYDVYQIPRQP